GYNAEAVKILIFAAEGLTKRSAVGFLLRSLIMFQTFISRHNSNFFSDKLVLTSVTPASSAPVLQTPKATSSTLYFDSLTVNAGNGGFLHCIQMDTSVNAANQVVSVGADIAFDADPKFFACLVRFESSSVPTNLPTAYDVYPLDGRFFFSSRRRHTSSDRDWSSDVCSSDLFHALLLVVREKIVSQNALPHLAHQPMIEQIGRASCRERVYIAAVAELLERKDRFDSSSVPTTLQTAYDTYPFYVRHVGGYYAV